MEETSLNLMHSAPRCLAMTRKGSACQSPAIRGKKRCWMHGGASTGAPKGNRNAWNHGLRSAEAMRVKGLGRELLRGAREFLDGLDAYLHLVMRAAMAEGESRRDAAVLRC